MEDKKWRNENTSIRSKPSPMSCRRPINRNPWIKFGSSSRKPSGKRESQYEETLSKSSENKRAQRFFWYRLIDLQAASSNSFLGILHFKLNVELPTRQSTISAQRFLPLYSDSYEVWNSTTFYNPFSHLSLYCRV